MGSCKFYLTVNNVLHMRGAHICPLEAVYFWYSSLIDLTMVYLDILMRNSIANVNCLTEICLCSMQTGELYLSWELVNDPKEVVQ